ncbi:HD domain-containing protein [Embleya sp. NPDC020886]|uniref:HD domain-containing protein n=1 Tax=Embleya sp. NPDC020886 TaxID=3363980 RepID=UPI0037BA9C4A
MTTAIPHPHPDLPTTSTAVRAIEYVHACESESVANHSVRSYLFAALFAEHEGLRPQVDFDPELLFLACVLHDLGTSPGAPGKQRFEVEGADLAAEFLSGHGVAAAHVDSVWEAIALHTSAGIAERRGVLTHLTRRGIGLDFGRDAEFVTDAQGQAIHARYPRLRMAATLTDEIVRHAERGAGNAPRYTLAGELVRERRETGLTDMERQAAAARWGE